MKDILG